jgi:hypothetical protein
MFIEARDALLAVLAPPLDLRHLIKRGKCIQKALAQKNSRRPPQMTRLKKILAH